MEEKIRGLMRTYSEVRVGLDFEGKSVVELRFEDGQNFATSVVVDRATAARLIRQIQRALDNSYNEMINQRPERDASKDYSSGY